MYVKLASIRSRIGENMAESDKLIINEAEAIECLKSNKPTTGYIMLQEAVDMAIQALEKQIPKKPVKSENQVARYVNTYYCPICNLGITGTNIAKWCYHCGQKLDWS